LIAGRKGRMSSRLLTDSIILDIKAFHDRPRSHRDQKTP
jgi:hypothetical protein